MPGGLRRPEGYIAFILFTHPVRVPLVGSTPTRFGFEKSANSIEEVLAWAKE
jgi:hypothetical protein